MKRLLLSTVLTLSLSGCFMPSGINPTLGCSPLTGCQEKDYYLPGKGVWAPKQTMFTKAKLGAIGGAAIGASMGKDPTSDAIYGVIGLVVGYSIGDTMDNIDVIHASQMMQTSLNNNVDGEASVYRNLNSQVQVVSTPVSTKGNCREFVSNVAVGKEYRKLRGTACLENKVWVMKNVY